MMGRTVRAAALGLCLLAAAACSHKDKNAPLAYVPADTPFLAANIKPLDTDTQDALLKRLDSQLPMQVREMQDAADKLRDEGKPDLANLVGELAHEFQGKTYQQIATDDGFDIHGLSAVYGVGLSPVARTQLADPAKFQAFVGRLEKAYGHPFETSKLGSVSYQHATLAGSGVQFIVAVVDKQMVAALVPAQAGKGLLGEVLGTQRPDHSVQDSGKLQKLADQRDYQPYFVGYLDTTRLAPLLAGGSDPLLMAISKGKGALPAGCRGDLERMASRVPMLSFGYTDIDEHQMSQQFDMDLAPDIVKAFKDVKVPLPGLGADLDAPLDIAFGIPLTDIRNFWMSQASAVAAKPFTCPQLSHMNQGFAKLGQAVQKTAIPPFSDLRGVRLRLQDLSSSGQGMPHVTGALVLASSNPQGLLAIGQSMLPDLAQLQIKPDGKPVALPGQASAMFGQPAWIAMNKSAIAVGIGAGEQDHLGELLEAEQGHAGELAKAHLDGAMYVKLLKLVRQHTMQVLQDAQAAAAKPGATPDQVAKAAEAANRVKAQMDAAEAQAKALQSMDTKVDMGEHGLEIHATVRMKP